MLSTEDTEVNQKKPCPREVYSLGRETEPSGKSGNETTMDNAKRQEVEIKVLGGLYPGGAKTEGALGSALS